MQPEYSENEEVKGVEHLASSSIRTNVYETNFQGHVLAELSRHGKSRLCATYILSKIVEVQAQQAHQRVPFFPESQKEKSLRSQ